MTIEQLAAIEQIKALKARYFRLVDTKAWDEFEALFTPDAPLVIAEAQPEAFTPRALTNLLRAHYGHCVTVHHGHMPEITVEGSDRASGIWAMDDQRFFTADDPSAPFTAAIGAGYYHETYILTADGWRIASLRLTRLRLDITPLPPAW